MQVDSHVLALLDLHGIPPLSVTRSVRNASNGSHDGVTLLELIVLASWAQAMLRHAELVGWLAGHHADALAAIQALADDYIKTASARPHP